MKIELTREEVELVYSVLYGRASKRIVSEIEYEVIEKLRTVLKKIGPIS